MSSTEPLTVESLTLPLESGRIQRCNRDLRRRSPGFPKEQTVRTLIAMPAYNEEKYIAKTVTGSRRYADAVLAVDGGSKDDTVEIARALGAIVVQHEGNRGYGWALQTIFCTAWDLGVEDLIIIDSDGQHNPRDILRLLAELRKDNDVVIGSRFVEGSAGEIPTYRKVGMRILDAATTLAGMAYGNRLPERVCLQGKRAIETIGSATRNERWLGSDQISDHRLKVASANPVLILKTSSENPFSHGIGVLMNLVKLIGFHGRSCFWQSWFLFTSFGIGGALPSPVLPHRSVSSSSLAGSPRYPRLCSPGGDDPCSSCKFLRWGKRTGEQAPLLPVAGAPVAASSGGQRNILSSRVGMIAVVLGMG